MKKRMWKWKVVIALLLCVGALGGNWSGSRAQAATYGDFQYKKINHKRAVEITKYKGKATKVTIPGKINGLPVTSIGKRAFSHCKKLKNVTIPKSVKSIGKRAFSDCGLTSITIPNGVTHIENNTFIYCYSLKSVTIPNGVKSIGEDAFFQCYSLKSVKIPKSVKSIGESAFYDCKSLKSVTIPKGVKSIGKMAFSHCDSLKSVKIPKSVKSIGESTFYGCISLTSITIPNSVTSIGESAFSYCTSLKSITIPNSVTSIGSGAFYGCTNLTSIIIPSSVKSIMTTVRRGNTTVHTGTFEGCDKNKLVIYTPEGSYAANYAKTNGFQVSYIPEPTGSSGMGVSIRSGIPAAFMAAEDTGREIRPCK